MGSRKITRATLHFRIVLKLWRITKSSAARGEEHVKAFGVVVDVLITAIGESFKTSEIVCFSSVSNLAAEVVVEKIIVQSAVDSKYGRV